VTSLPASAVRAYRTLYAAQGLRLFLTRHMPAHNWNATGYVRTLSEGEYVDMVSHELAHYLVATPFERTQLEYGLGCSPISTVEVHRTTWRDADEVEALASVLGVWIAVRVEGRHAAQYVAWHNWDWQSFRFYTEKLLKNGFLVWRDGKIMPRCLVKSPRKRDIWRST
jgi:hypothetical protein